MTTSLIRMYSMYVIGEVESGWDWTSIYYVDAITIGMMQNWGESAADMLNRIKNAADHTDWNYLVANAPSLTNDVNNHAASSSWWEDRYLTHAEGNALVHVMSNDGNHVIQQNMWYEYADAYVSKLVSLGMSESHPKELIFGMCMYHQSPKRCREVLQAVGGSANLDRLKAGAMNNSILSKYKTRYNTAYNRLKAWNGTSMPPDFGQVQTTPTSEGSGGDSPASGVSPENLGYIIQQGDTLVLYGPITSNRSKGVVFHPASGQRWVSGINIPAPNVPDGSTTTPVTPPTDPNDAKIAAMLAWLVSKVGAYAYSQGAGRLNPESSGYTDCSALMHYAYEKFLGINVGTWTGDQIGRGHQVWEGMSDSPDYSKLEAGDLVFYYAKNSTSKTGLHHVEMYMGNTGTNAHKVIGHG